MSGEAFSVNKPASVNLLRPGASLDAPLIITPPSARPYDYVSRRWHLFQPSDQSLGVPFDEITMGAISRLPLPLQVAFRLKMLGIFELQLLVVWAVVAVFRYEPQAKDVADRFFDPPVARLVIAFVAGLALLVGLYFARNRFPLNWGLLLFFTFAQCLCFVGLGVVLDTNIGVINCGFTFLSVLIMIVLSCVRSRKGEQEMLFSSFYAGLIGYGVSALVTSILYLVFRHDFATKEGFGATLGFQLLLLLWFSYDAMSMYQIMSPDEYMHGVIYFYTDLILLVAAIAAIVGAALACAALVATCEGGADVGDADCSSCGMISCNGCYCDVGSSYAPSNQRNNEEDNGTMDRV